jgi:hypothetical protein
MINITPTQGNLELHLFTLTANNTLVELARSTSPGTTNRVLTATVAAGQPLLVEVKGAPITPGVFGTGSYTMSASLNVPGSPGISTTDSDLSATGPGISYNQADWTLAGSTVGSDGNTRLLWVNGDGQAAVWTVDNSGASSNIQVFGPFSGWRPVALASGGDGLTRLLWDNTNGDTALWLLNADNTMLRVSVYGQNPGWTATSVAVGSGTTSQTRLLWENSNGQMAVWTVGNNFVSSANLTFPISNAVVFGPITGWSTRAIAVSPTDVPWILWDNGSSGQAALWELNPDNTFSLGQGYTPPSGWTAIDLTVGSDGNARLLWEETGGATAVWTISSGTLAQTNNGVYGPYSGYAAVGLAAGSDNLTRLIWTKADGSQALWLLNADDTFATAFYYPPLPE